MIPPMSTTIRPATEADASFIAWVQQEAARSHLPYGFWDLAFIGPDSWRLALIEKIVRAEARSFCHWSSFLIAEVDGVPAAGLSGYDKPSVTAGELLFAAMEEAFRAVGWTELQAGAMQERIVPFLTCIPETAEDDWVIEWVATRPEHRGKGLVKQLLQAILARGAERGHAQTQIAVLIGNTAAQRAYESAGFRVVDDKTSTSFEATFGTPGIRRMLR
jgi:ribosomal protein S18 acetylase RimI-like enzyme